MTKHQNISVTMGLAALLFAGGAKAQNITVSWTVLGDNIGTGYLPKVASDGLNDVVAIAETGTGLSPFEDQLGWYPAAQMVQWSGTWSALYGPTRQIGHAPSIALAFGGPDLDDDAIEVHQGGQNGESSLWFQLAGWAPMPSIATINWGPASRLGPGPSTCGPLGCSQPQYDLGYNPTVAADNEVNGGGGDLKSATIVEMHQTAAGESALYYHVGVLTLGLKPSITWGPSLPFDSSGKTLGYAPTVSIAHNIAVLVSEGSGGTLWYAIGAVDKATSTIAWTAPVPYGTGYNPTVSVYGDGSDLWISGRVLVEAHQMDNGTGPLVYNVGILKGSLPTSITWNPNPADTNINYANGCYPSVALAFDGDTGFATPPSPSQVSVTETHETACGSATKTEYSFGYLIGK